MKAIVTLLAVALIGIASAGCSPSIGQWVARGTTGVQLAQQNQTAWYQAEKASLNKARNASVNACYTDTINAFANGVATSQPAGTKAVTAQWVNDQRTVLLATLKAYDAENADLDAKYATAMQNLGSVTECFTEINRLNVVWATQADQLASDLSSLNSIVSQLQAQQAAKTTTGK
jgi:hypothetical protein